MFINQIQFGSLASSQTANMATVQNNNFFTEFASIVDEARLAEEQVAQDAYNLSIGQADNLHEITINSAKAEISLQLMVQLRNKLLDSYKEIMQMGI